MKFGQLTESNMRNIFVENLYTKHSGDSSPIAFSENLKLNKSLDK